MRRIPLCSMFTPTRRGAQCAPISTNSYRTRLRVKKRVFSLPLLLSGRKFASKLDRPWRWRGFCKLNCESGGGDLYTDPHKNRGKPLPQKRPEDKNFTHLPPTGHSERRLSNFLKRFSLTNGERPAKNLVASKRKVSRFFVGLCAVETEKDLLQ